MRKILAWACAIAVVLAIGIGGAFAFGLVDAIFESPMQGLITLVGTALGIIALLVLTYFWESFQDRRKHRSEKVRKR